MTTAQLLACPSRITRYFGQRMFSLAGCRRDARVGSFSTYVPNTSLGRHVRFLPTLPLSSYRSVLLGLTENYLAHRFDLLGSGWVEVRHGMLCRGLEGKCYDMARPVQATPDGKWLDGRINPANVVESKRIWQSVNGDYEPIDWQLDFKSGYRWSEATWYRNVRYGRHFGADIKVPWELARMQHLPQLALTRVLIGESGTDGDLAARCATEFRNQVLDFIAANPPRFGVNWVCTMDVGIRVVNWLIAYDLFRASDVVFDQLFEDVLCRSVYEHACHIAGNLEWGPRLRGNHYLADVVGLLTASVYLPRTEQTDAWLAFSVQELVNEVNWQFHHDGTSVEGSTCYHRLTAEMVVYGTALILGLGRERMTALENYDPDLGPSRPRLGRPPIPLYRLTRNQPPAPFPEWYVERVWRMGEFVRCIAKPNGEIPQVGDNDSGRLLKLTPVYDALTIAEAKAKYAHLDNYAGLLDGQIYWDEKILDHNHLLNSVAGLFPDHSQESSQSLETLIVRWLATGKKLTEHQFAGECLEIGNNKILFTLQASPSECLLSIPLRSTEVSWHAFPDFGLYVFRCDDAYVAVRCASPDSRDGAHCHEDHLSVEIAANGRDLFRDPGTYVYTPLPEVRHRYRHESSHSGPFPAGSVLRPGAPLFRAPSRASSECLYFGAAGFAGVKRAQRTEWFRSVSIRNGAMSVCDHFPMGSPGMRSVKAIPVSPGYGKLLRSSALVRSIGNMQVLRCD